MESQMTQQQQQQQNPPAAQQAAQSRENESSQRHPSPVRSPPSNCPKTEQERTMTSQLGVQCKIMTHYDSSLMTHSVPISPYPQQNSPLPKYESPSGQTTTSTSPLPMIMPR